MNEQFKVTHPSEDVFNKLQNLYEAGDHASLLEHGIQILSEYPTSFLIQNIVAGSFIHLGQTQKLKSI